MSGSFPLSLAGGKTENLMVSFTSSSSGTVGGSLFVSGPAISVPLYRHRILARDRPIAIAPTALSYGNVNVGTTDTLPLTISAVGASVHGFLGIERAVLNLSCRELPSPDRRPSGQSLALNVAFTPKSSRDGDRFPFVHRQRLRLTASESQPAVGTSIPYSVSI